jgi:hypothetical protein
VRVGAGLDVYHKVIQVMDLSIHHSS